MAHVYFMPGRFLLFSGRRLKREGEQDWAAHSRANQKTKRRERKGTKENACPRKRSVGAGTVGNFCFSAFDAHQQVSDSDTHTHTHTQTHTHKHKHTHIHTHTQTP